MLRTVTIAFSCLLAVGLIGCSKTEAPKPAASTASGDMMMKNEGMMQGEMKGEPTMKSDTMMKDGKMMEGEAK